MKESDGIKLFILHDGSLAVWIPDSVHTNNSFLVIVVITIEDS